MIQEHRDKIEEYNPIGCDHKIKHGKYKGFSSFSFQGQSSGSGPDIYFEHNVSVCLLCGDIHVSGYEQKQDGRLHRYDNILDIHHPEAVTAIVKACNFFNKETEDYIPFTQLAETHYEDLLDRMAEGASVISLLCEADGTPVDGFRFKEGVQALRKTILEYETLKQQS